MKQPLLFIFLLTWIFSAGRVIHVGKSFPVKTIRGALDMSREGDTVVVHPGVYKEGNIVIDKRVVLKGIGFPVLDGEHKYEMLSVKAPGTVITGFRMRASGSGSLDDPCAVKVYDSHHVTIHGNILEDNFFGIYLQYSKHCTVSSNTLSSHGLDEQRSGNGIHCWKSDSLRITGNRVSGHRDGIYFEFVTNSMIDKNVAYGNVRYGLHFMFSNNDAYVGNEFRDNGAGVAVMFTKKVTMKDNIFAENWGDAAYGLLLKEISDSHISGNRFTRNTSGIYMEGTSRILVENNLFQGNGWGMKIQASCMENEIRNNNFMGNTFDVSTNGSLVLNTFSANYWDKYEGYDLNRDGRGDVPYRPLSLFSVIVESNPSAMLLFRSFIVGLLDKTEKIIPSITPDNFIDNEPRMRRAEL
jgi:nitrous oxidase accessory protein